jgi:hypothetical protein
MLTVATPAPAETLAEPAEAVAAGDATDAALVVPADFSLLEQPVNPAITNTVLPAAIANPRITMVSFTAMTPRGANSLQYLPGSVEWEWTLCLG